jgi:hypothetical protein
MACKGTTLPFFYQCVQRNTFDYFDIVNEYLEESGKAVSQNAKHDVTEQLG